VTNARALELDPFHGFDDQSVVGSPLPWLDDLDNDGKAELIIWDSFPLHEDASQAEYGLVAWVYRLASEDLLAIDWGLSLRMAREIAQAYGQHPAAEALEQFADKQCLSQNSPR
jgi:hypothetical protein